MSLLDLQVSRFLPIVFLMLLVTLCILTKKLSFWPLGNSNWRFFLLIFQATFVLACKIMSFLSISISFSLYLIISRITCQKTYCFCCSYDLGSVYLQLCDMLYITENHNYEKLVDPSIFIPRFSNSKYFFSVLGWCKFFTVFHTC